MASTASRLGLIVFSVTQMVFLASSLGSVGFFLNEFNKAEQKQSSIADDVGLFGREEFFLFSVSIGIVIALFSMIIGMTQSHEKAQYAASMLAAHVLLLLLLVVSSSLLIKTETIYDRNLLCDALKLGTDARCYQLIIGVVSAFLSVALFIGSTVIYCTSLLGTVRISFINMDN
ncbi:uncharacterized protein LOC124441914 [Xenia sp. Carnegie-2017]|uniref:uncharacterized protein LOC124441914 n=1 Tax=Xenia sp. Carnegie-2017 TaxID=2897299 RepID=UPI001F04F0B8|nr:uncharacterized protein LOC124441914 [Xenia sp. Carnegie-2017]